MRWRLEEKHYIDDQVLEPGTLVGDETEHPYVFTKADPKLGRKVGEPMPPSRAMTPMDEEARAVWRKAFGDEPVERDPLKAIPLTGAQGSPTVKPNPTKQPENVKQGPATQKEPEQPKTGMLAESKPPLSPSTPQPTPKPELQKPAGHDSSKNPGDSKDTETAKAPDIKKI